MCHNVIFLTQPLYISSPVHLNRCLVFFKTSWYCHIWMFSQPLLNPVLVSCSQLFILFFPSPKISLIFYSSFQCLESFLGNFPHPTSPYFLLPRSSGPLPPRLFWPRFQRYFSYQWIFKLLKVSPCNFSHPTSLHFLLPRPSGPLPCLV